ncbi:hypothetical protein C4J96_3656 [Pseudomonas orientalis]|nr:hypothetical protein C4J96_3656 [Pseudomonas orientalis]
MNCPNAFRARNSSNYRSITNVGGGLPPMAVCQSKDAVTDTRQSGHRYLNNSAAPNRNHDAKRVALDLAFDLDLRRPVKPRWPNAGLNPWATRQDAGLAALGQGWPIAAAHGFKPERGHTEPKRGAEWWGKSPLVTLGLFQSDPPSGRNPKWPLPKEWICTRSDPTSWSARRPPSGASPLPHLDLGASGRYALAPSPQVRCRTKIV